MKQEANFFSLDGLRVRVMRVLDAMGGRDSEQSARATDGLVCGSGRDSDHQQGLVYRSRRVSVHQQGLGYASRRVFVHQQGFSLIEMLLVLGIIAFIATMLATNIFTSKGKADVKAAQAGVRKVATAVDQYYLDSGTLPSKIEELVTRPGNAANWGGPYLNESQIKDPWGTVYTMKVPGEGGQPYAVISLGSDKAPGGADTAADVDNNQ